MKTQTQEHDTVNNFSDCHRKAVAELLSPEFLPLADCQWFVMRVTYGRADKAVEHITREACKDLDKIPNETGNALSLPYFAYTPHETKVRIKDGKRKKERVACLPGYIFFYGREADAFRFTHRSQEDGALPFLDFAYDHTSKTLSGTDKRMIIQSHEMLNFMRLAEIDSPKAYSVTAEECHFRKGGKVRIVHGVFKGIVGRVARIHSQTRVVVTLEGIIQYATAYIPSAFMVPVEDHP